MSELWVRKNGKSRKATKEEVNFALFENQLGVAGGEMFGDADCLFDNIEDEVKETIEHYRPRLPID